MTRYILGGLAAAALAFTGCNKAGTGYSGNEPVRNDTQYQRGYDTNQTAPGNVNEYGQGESGAQKDMATGRDLKDKEQNPANLPAPQMMSITGTVKDAGHGSLTLVTGTKGEVKLNTGDYTRVTGMDGVMIKTHEIKEGSEVRASYKFDGKDNKAMTIEVTRTPAGNAIEKGTINNTDDMQKTK